MSLDRSVRLLSRAPVIRTEDPEAMEHAFLTVYGATGFAVSNTDDFEGLGNYLQLASIGLGFCAYGGAKTVVEFPETTSRACKLASRQRRDHSKRPGARDNRTTILHSFPGGTNTIVFEPGYEQLILRINTVALDKTLTTLLGAKPGGVLSLIPLGPRCSRPHWFCAIWRCSWLTS